ncbi:MAG: hypothetical protein ACRD6U_03915, partial [Nitrososphaeraceae archaeon]
PPGANGTNGLQGPPGPPGANGTNGLQGPPGPSRINATNLYSVNGTTLAGTSTAFCDVGDFVLGGGYRVTSPGNNQIPVVSAPLGTENGWRATIFGSSTITATAMCFDNTPPAHIPQP